MNLSQEEKAGMIAALNKARAETADARWSGSWWPNAKNLREERRAIRKRMNSDLKRAVALSSMAEKNVIPVRIGDGSTDFFQVQSYKKCTALELHNAGFKGIL